MTTILPIDANDNVIPALRLRDGAAHTVAATTGGSANNAAAFSTETRIISLYASTPVYIRFGEAGVIATSTDHYFPSGVYYDLAIGGYGVDHTPYMAVLATDTDGDVYISEKE